MDEYPEVGADSPEEVKKIAREVESSFQTKPTTYEELIDTVKGMAKARLDGGDSIDNPTFFFLDEEGMMSVVVSPDVPPRILREILIKLFEERKAVAYCVMSEIWTAVFEPGDLLVEPRNANNKRDAYMVAGATRLGKKQVFVGPVEKDGQKTLSAGALSEMPGDVTAMYDGFLSIFDGMEKPTVN